MEEKVDTMKALVWGVKNGFIKEGDKRHKEDIRVKIEAARSLKQSSAYVKDGTSIEEAISVD